MAQFLTKIFKFQVTRYALVGIINTIIHILVFFCLHSLFMVSQSFSNFFAFTIAIILSFFLNAKITFKVSIRLAKLFIYYFFIASINFTIGLIADIINIAPVLTISMTIVISFVVGFLGSRYFIFNE